MKSLPYQNGFSMKKAIHDPPTFHFQIRVNSFPKKPVKN